MKKLLKLSILTLFAALFAVPAFSQCDTWLNKPNKDLLEEAHVLYRQFMKTEEYDQAFPHWKVAYEGAPAADGQRSSHFKDGRKIYIHKYKNETDEAKKAEYAKIINDLVEQQIECYPDDKADALAQHTYDMFYEMNALYSDNMAVAKRAVEAGGNKTSYAVFRPYATMAVYQYQQKLIDAAEARDVFIKLNEIADFQIADNNDYSETYKGEKAFVATAYAPIESEIFDCAYFKSKFEPDFRKDSEDPDNLKYWYNKLIDQGCDENDPFVAEVKAKFDEVVGAINAARLAEFYAANPGEHGIALFKEGKYSESLEKFEEGIKQEEAGENDTEKLANYYFYMASVEFRQLGRYGDARTHARKAAALKSGWGRPYMLIGDMYAKTSSSCGKDVFDAQVAILAAVDKYAYAKSIDPEVADEANKKIGGYADSRPEKGDLFLRGLQEGQSYTVPCWIGETVKLRSK